MGGGPTTCAAEVMVRSGDGVDGVRELELDPDAVGVASWDSGFARFEFVIADAYPVTGLGVEEGVVGAWAL